jgi:hypothetical protein
MDLEQWLEHKEAKRKEREAKKARGYQPSLERVQELQRAKPRRYVLRRPGDTRSGLEPRGEVPRPPARQKRVAPMSDKRKVELQQYAKLKRIWMKGKRCERCNAAATDLHHKRGRTGSLLIDVRHWVALCRPCHDWVGAHIAEAREAGLICAEGEWNKTGRTHNE